MVFLLSALAAGTLAGAWLWISRDLPSVDQLMNFQFPGVTKVLDDKGQLMAEFFVQRRYPVKIKHIPAHVVNAFVAAEDGDFYHHPGVDVLGVLRAAYANFKAGRVVQGGSTITQQVAKRLLLSPQRTFIRKIKEAILALRIEKHLSKEQILYLYLNQIYMGHGAYGIEAAARTYYDKPALDLTIAEGALLAGIIKAPSRYSPWRYARRARTRQVYVIERMKEDGFITPEQAAEAMSEDLNLSREPHKPPTVNAPYYTEAVRQWLAEKFGNKMLYEGALTVYTACNAELTSAGQKSIADGLHDLSRRHGFKGVEGRLTPGELEALLREPLNLVPREPGEMVLGVVTKVDAKNRWVELRFDGGVAFVPFAEMEWALGYNADPKKLLAPGDQVRIKLEKLQPQSGWWQAQLSQTPKAQAALLAMDVETGWLKVIIGGRDFESSQFNRAIQAHRQPGSAFKPFIYAAAMDYPDRLYTPTSVIIDAPVIYDDPAVPGEKWKPKNYTSRFYGATTLRQALEHSRNVVTVKLLAELGLKYAVEYARRFGFGGALDPNLSLALGTCEVTPLEVTRAFGVFADQGRLTDSIMVVRVVDSDGRMLYQSEVVKKQVISPQTAFVMTHILKGVIEEGTGTQMLQLGRPLAGKTGTTNDLRDAWFVGFSPNLVCGVWVGQDDNLPLGNRETGARAAGPIWREFMRAALKDEPVTDFPVPEGVVFSRVDRQTGAPLSAGDAGGFFEAFKTGSEPQARADGSVTIPQTRPEDFMQSEAFAQ